MIKYLGLLVLFFSLSSSAVELEKMLEGIRQEYNLPAIAAAVTKDGKIIASAAVGVRKSGTDIKVTLQDKFHIGSCTKSMTATLAAILVEEGKIKWNSTIKEIFPELSKGFHKAYHKVTLEQLLSHTGGVHSVPNSNQPLWLKIYANKSTMTPIKQRDFLIKEVLKLPPAYEPGKSFVYSNSSITIAAMMLEKVTGRAWEGMLIEKLAKPLKITSIGYGIAIKDNNKIDQPFGHYFDGKKHTAFGTGKFIGNPSSIAPAGLVHLSVEDFARYTAFYADKAKQLMKEDSFMKVTTPVKNNYALCWITVQRGWGGRVLTHSGSNTINHAVMWIAPEKRFSLIVLTNTEGEKVAQGLDKTAGLLIGKYLK